jgi:hypothetical protein
MYLYFILSDQKSDILAEKSPIRASRKALDMLFDSVEDQGRFAALRDALDGNGGRYLLHKYVSDMSLIRLENNCQILSSYNERRLKSVKSVKILGTLM